MTDQDTDPQQPPVPAYPQELAAFAEELRDLRISCGNPSLRDLERAAPSARPLSASAISEALAGKRLPRLDFLITLVYTLLGVEDGHPVGRDDPRVKHWRARWEQLERARVKARPTAAPRPVPSPGAVESRPAEPDEPVVEQPGPPAGPQSASPARTSPLVRTLDGHTDSVVAVAFSPDGRLLATASLDRTVRLWNPATGQPVGEPLTGHTDAFGSVAFSPDGRLLATASGDQTARLWDPATGRPVGEPLTGHTDAAGSVAFSPDGHLLATVGNDQTVRLWDPVTGRPLGERLTGHTGAVMAAAFSPDGRLLATAGYDQTVRLRARVALLVTESATRAVLAALTRGPRSESGK